MKLGDASNPAHDDDRQLQAQLDRVSTACEALAKTNVRLARKVELDELLLQQADRIIGLVRLVVRTDRDRAVLDEWLARHQALKP